MMDYKEIRTATLRHLYLDKNWRQIHFDDILKIQVDKLKDTPFIRLGVWEYEPYSDDYYYRVISYHRVSVTGRILAGIEDYTSIYNFLRELALKYKEELFYEKTKNNSNYDLIRMYKGLRVLYNKVTGYYSVSYAGRIYYASDDKDHVLEFYKEQVKYIYGEVEHKNLLDTPKREWTNIKPINYKKWCNEVYNK